MACFATPYGLRYAAHCFNRAHAQQNGSALIPAGGKLGVTSQTMKRTRFSEEQIIGVLKEAEAGAKTADLARQHGVSEATIYNWKSKYGGLEVSEARRLKELESENAKLKRLLADAMLDQAALKDLLAKKF